MVLQKILRATPRFNKLFKKFFPKEQKNIKDAIHKIAGNLLTGKPKKGPLKGIRVFKFQSKKKLILLSYKPDHKKKTVTMYALGSHENYYAKLAKYKKGK